MAASLFRMSALTASNLVNLVGQMGLKAWGQFCVDLTLPVNQPVNATWQVMWHVRQRQRSWARTNMSASAFDNVSTHQVILWQTAGRIVACSKDNAKMSSHASLLHPDASWRTSKYMMIIKYIAKRASPCEPSATVSSTHSIMRMSSFANYSAALATTEQLSRFLGANKFAAERK